MAGFRRIRSKAAMPSMCHLAEYEMNSHRPLSDTRTRWMKLRREDHGVITCEKSVENSRAHAGTRIKRTAGGGGGGVEAAARTPHLDKKAYRRSLQGEVAVSRTDGQTPTTRTLLQQPETPHRNRTHRLHTGRLWMRRYLQMLNNINIKKKSCVPEQDSGSLRRWARELKARGLLGQCQSAPFHVSRSVDDEPCPTVAAQTAQCF